MKRFLVVVGIVMAITLAFSFTSSLLLADNSEKGAETAAIFKAGSDLTGKTVAIFKAGSDLGSKVV